jgi:hypothetical protein
MSQIDQRDLLQQIKSGPLYYNNDIRISLARRTAMVFRLRSETLGEAHAGTIFTGVEIAGKHPYTSFYDKGEPYAIVSLSENAATNWGTAYHEFAHESVHLLCLVDKEEVTMLEEGVACWLAEEFWFQMYNKRLEQGPRNEPDKTALRHVREWEANGLIPAVKELRTTEPSISRFTAKMLIDSVPNMPEAVAQYLVSKAWPKV